jgi:hypothetical protein
MIVASLGARIVGMAGTLTITHYLVPHVVGEVSAANIVV